jgi:hypothetical protein
MVSGMAEAIDLPKPSKDYWPISDSGNQVYVQRVSDHRSPEWKFDFYESIGPNWRRTITRNYGINAEAINEAIVDKRQKLGRYRAAAKKYRASQVWLLLVAESVLGLDLHIALYDEDGKLSALANSQPQFDEIHLLAGGPNGPPWKHVRLWPRA